MEKQKILKIKRHIDEKKVKDWLNLMLIKNYHINDDFTVDVNGSVHIPFKGLSEIPIRFRKVNGDFCCDRNILTSLKGCPTYVYGNFFCGKNRLTSLEYSPEYVSGIFFCQDNNLTTLEGCTKKIGGNLKCGGNNLKTLEDAPKEPASYGSNPCTDIYKQLGFTDHAHQKCREVFGYES